MDKIVCKLMSNWKKYTKNENVKNFWIVYQYKKKLFERKVHEHLVAWKKWIIKLDFLKSDFSP